VSLANTTSAQQHRENRCLGTSRYNLGSPVQCAATSAPSKVNSFAIDPCDEVEMDASQGPDIREHPARDSDRDLVLFLENDEFHALVSEQIAKKKVDFENGATLHPSGSRTERVRRTDGHLGSAPITFIAELTLRRLEPALHFRCDDLIDVVGTSAKIPWRGSEKWGQEIRVFGEVEAEVRRSRFGSPQ
jgi:hypothetical protein